MKEQQNMQIALGLTNPDNTHNKNTVFQVWQLGGEKGSNALKLVISLFFLSFDIHNKLPFSRF